MGRGSNGTSGSVETSLAIETRSAAGAAFRVRRAGAANPLVGDAIPFCGDLDGRA